MKLVWIFGLTIFIIFLGCVASSDQVKEIYERQTMLETQIESLSKDIQEMEKKRDQQITKIQKNIEQVYSKLNKRLSKLEKTSGSEEADSLGSPLVESPDALYLKAESYYQEGKYRPPTLGRPLVIRYSSIPNERARQYLKQGLS